MPRFRIRIRLLYVSYAVTALGVVAAAWASRVAIQCGAGLPLLLAGLGVLIALAGLSWVWFDPILQDTPEVANRRRLVLSPKRMQRLLKAAEFLPEPTPAGWHEPFAPKGTTAWLSFAGEVAIWSWLFPEDAGNLYVTLFGKEKGVRVADDRAVEILAHFRGAGPFAEVSEAPQWLVDANPSARTWVALPYETIAALPPLPARPALLDRPLNQHLEAARRFLPLEVPLGWSPPLAFADPTSEWKDGAWMVNEDEACIVVTLVTSEGRVKLMVSIFHPSGEEVNEARAYRVLKHFRGIREFKQTDDTDGVPGSRLYLGEIDASGARALLN